MASESLTLLVMRFSIISGKWKVLLSPSPARVGTRMPGYAFTMRFLRTIATRARFARATGFFARATGFFAASEPFALS